MPGLLKDEASELELDFRHTESCVEGTVVLRYGFVK